MAGERNKIFNGTGTPGRSVGYPTCGAEKHGERPHGQAQEYQRFAAECVELTQTTAEPAHKARLLLMAKRWLDLAFHARRSVRRPRVPLCEAPEVVKKLGPFRLPH